jgi:hypothetical protein
MLIVNYTGQKGLFYTTEYCQTSLNQQESFACNVRTSLVLDLYHGSHPRGWSLFLTFFSFTARYEGGGRNVNLHNVY